MPKCWLLLENYASNTFYHKRVLFCGWVMMFVSKAQQGYLPNILIEHHSIPMGFGSQTPNFGMCLTWKSGRMFALWGNDSLTTWPFYPKRVWDGLDCWWPFPRYTEIVRSRVAHLSPACTSSLSSCSTSCWNLNLKLSFTKIFHST